MAIMSPCEQCGQKHSIDDSFAGKRFHCKACGEMVTIPSAADVAAVRPSSPARPARAASAGPAASAKAVSSPSPAARPQPKPQPKVEDDWDSLIEDQGEPIEEEELPVETKSKPKKAKQKTSKASGGLSRGTSAALIGGGVFGFLIVVVLAVKIIPNLPELAKGKAKWRTWSHPSGQVQIDMPAAPTSQYEVGQQVYVGEVRLRYTCKIAVMHFPAPLARIPREVVADQLMENMDQMLKSNQTIESRKRIEIQGHPAIEIQGTEDGINQTGRLILTPQKIVAIEFAYKQTEYPEERKRYFDSLKLIGL